MIQKSKIFIGTFCFIFLLFYFYGYAQAHPHVWIDPGIKFIFSSNALEGLNLTYTFDEMYSTMELIQFDKNKNGRLEEKEKELLGKQILEEIKGSNYCIHLKDGSRNILVAPQIADINIEEDERLSLTLKISYNVLLDNSDKIIAVSVYDKNYYYEIMNPSEETVTVEGKNYIHYSLQFNEDDQESYYYDQFYPTYIIIKFKKRS